MDSEANGGADDEASGVSWLTRPDGRSWSARPRMHHGQLGLLRSCRQRKGAKQALRGPDGVAYRLAISACARAPGGHRWRDGIRLLNEMRENNATDTDTKLYIIYI